MGQMSTQQQMLVEQRLSNEKKSTGVAYLLWFFLATFAAHRFYLGKTASAMLMVFLFWGGLILSIVYIGFFMLIAFGVWILVDAFLIPGMIEQDANSKRARISNEVALTTTS